MSLNIKKMFESYFTRGLGCWIWQGNKLKEGYGRFCFNGMKTRAHRFSYELYCGPIKNGLLVCHSCDTPACVNPEHLWLGTTKENIRDAASKNRLSHGESHKSSKITKKTAYEIRGEYARKSIGQEELARKYGVSRGCVIGIVKNRTWKDLGELQFI